MDTLALVLLFALVALFVIRAWKAEGRLSARDRWALITSFALATAAFGIAAILVNWVVVPTAIWLIAVLLFAVGAAAAVLRWQDLTWSTGRHPIRRAVGIGATLLTCALIVGVAVI